MTATPVINYLAAALFALAVLHTFSTKFFETLAHRQPAHAGLWHLLGEVEVVFGVWAMALVAGIFALMGKDSAVGYLESRNFTEPMFVFVIMVIAGTRPILEVAGASVRYVARHIPLPDAMATYFLLLAFVPLMGSFITEPAAMTLAALMLRDSVFARQPSSRLLYVTVGVLLVNISIGGTLTPFAAPPVLMVAAKWNWDFWFMVSNFGWKAAVAVLINAGCAMLLLRKELMQIDAVPRDTERGRMPLSVVLMHLLFMLAVVLFAHHPVVFMGIFLFFLGFTAAYDKHQDKLILREALLVAFFLAGLVVLGGLQAWWLQPLLLGMDETTVFFGAAILTAFTDNAALTYLGSLVEGLSPEFKIALVAGAVTGGGLTVIANAPNPAGLAILKEKFGDGGVNPLGLLIAALPPTLVSVLAFRLL